jgi:uncharacterized protein (UPF0303 family)
MENLMQQPPRLTLDGTEWTYVTDGTQDYRVQLSVLAPLVSLTPSNDDIIQRKAGAWINRTPAQFKTDLALAKADVGLGNVDNTSDASKPISSLTQTALNGKQDVNLNLTAIAGLTPSNNDIIQRKSGAWFSRTPAQFKVDLALVKGDVGLGNVDNTADADKPVSSAMSTALGGKQASSIELTAIAGITASNDDIIQRKAGAWINRTPAQLKNDLALVKGDVGLGNVDNTSDVNKPISTAVSVALGNKQNTTAELTAFLNLTPSNDDLLQRKAGVWANRTPAQVKTDLALVKGDVGLANVDNTSDVNKPVSTATQTALNGKQPLNTDLTTISGLTPANDDLIQRKGGVWVTRTPVQLKTDLALVKGDVGLGNVDNTSDVNKPISTATQGALDNKQAIDADLTAISALAATGIAARTAADTWALRTLAAPAAGITITDADGVAGNPTFALANDLSAVEGLSTTGLTARTAADTWATRTLTAPAAGITIADAGGVAGNPTFALANDLAALEGLASTGIAVRTTTDTWAQRTIQPTTNQTTVTNGSGAAGDPTIGIASNPVLPGTEGVTLSGGTTAQRPGSPLDGEWRHNTTEEILEGYISPYGTAASPSAFQRTMIYPKRVVKIDEFTSGSNQANGSVAIYGELGWTITVSNNSTFTTQPAESNHPGILRINAPSGGVGRSSRLHLGVTSTTTVILANQIEYMAFLFRLPVITTMRLLAGSGTDIASTTLGTAGVRFQFDPAVSAALQFFCRSGGTDSAASNGPSLVANTWYLAEAFYDGTAWTPVINGTAYSAVTTQVPTAAVNVGVDMITNVNGTRSVDLDLFSMISRELGARY